MKNTHDTDALARYLGEGASAPLIEMAHTGYLTLDEASTESWEDEGPDGDAHRRDVRELARQIANWHGRTCEIWSHDLCVLDAIDDDGELTDRAEELRDSSDGEGVIRSSVTGSHTPWQTACRLENIPQWIIEELIDDC
jgi:hypothetical protein